jgi:cytochrome c553
LPAVLRVDRRPSDRRFTNLTTKVPMIRANVLVAALGLAATASIAVAQTPPPAGDPEKGRQKVAMCQGCHGIPGWRTAYPEVYQVPKIGGQHPVYLVNALKDYKSGARTHPSMRAIAASLSDADMADIAAYYGQSGLATKP